MKEQLGHGGYRFLCPLQRPLVNSLRSPTRLLQEHRISNMKGTTSCAVHWVHAAHITVLSSNINVQHASI